MLFRIFINAIIDGISFQLGFYADGTAIYSCLNKSVLIEKVKLAFDFKKKEIIDILLLTGTRTGLLILTPPKPNRSLFNRMRETFLLSINMADTKLQESGLKRLSHFLLT